jgi:hypothetical protein
MTANSDFREEGGIGSVASKGVTEGDFRICGKYRGYRRNCGCVARKGVREQGTENRKRKMETEKWGTSGMKSHNE